MLQTKIFKINSSNDVEKFEKLVKDYPPVGVNGLKILPEYLLLTYENGEVMGKHEKIQHLIGELNTLIGNQIDEIRQFKDGLHMLSLIDFYVRRSDWKDMRKNLIPMAKNCELSSLKIDVIVESLKELGREVKVDHYTLPPFPEEPILAPKGK